MKALSIKQPWASLIAHGIKDIENRTWKTNFRGRIYIHSSATGVKSQSFNYDQANALSEIDTDKIKFHNSAIIGEVDIIDCVINHESIWAEKTPFAQMGNLMFHPKKSIYNWVLSNAVLYPEPILNVKGKLSFWKYEPFEEIKTLPKNNFNCPYTI